MYQFYLAFIFVCITNGAVSAELSVSNSCTDKPLSFELSELKFAFDLKNISSINVLNGEAAASSITFHDNWLPDLHVITTSEDHVSGGINTRGGYQTLGVTNIPQLFEKIKYDASTDEYFLKVKRAMGLTDPNDIQIINHENYNVYVMNDAFDSKEAIYVIRKNDPRIIMLVADFSDAQLTRVLANTCL